MLAELDRTGENQISLTDPDSRAMAAHTHVAVGYNVQVAVDIKHKLIVEQQVTNQVVDMGLLTRTAEPAKEILGVATIDVVADKGYFKIEDIEACEKAGMVPYVPRPQRGPSVREGLFRKDEFTYEAETDSMICPAGQRLHPYSSSMLRGLKKINYANRAACPDCVLRPRCTGNRFRSVSRLENEAVLDRMAARLARRPGILDRRRESVEHPFGTIKQWMYQGAFLMRRLEKVRAEFSLTALAYNIRRVLNLVPFDALMVGGEGRAGLRRSGGPLRDKCELGGAAPRKRSQMIPEQSERSHGAAHPSRSAKSGSSSPRSAFPHGLLDFCGIGQRRSRPDEEGGPIPGSPA